MKTVRFIALLFVLAASTGAAVVLFDKTLNPPPWAVFTVLAVAGIALWRWNPAPKPVVCTACVDDRHIHDLNTNQCIVRGCECEVTR